MNGEKRLLLLTKFLDVNLYLETPADAALILFSFLSGYPMLRDLFDEIEVLSCNMDGKAGEELREIADKKTASFLATVRLF